MILRTRIYIYSIVNVLNCIKLYVWAISRSDRVKLQKTSGFDNPYNEGNYRIMKYMCIYFTSIGKCPTIGSVQEYRSTGVNLSYGWYYFSRKAKALFVYNFHNGVGNNHKKNS